MSSRTRLREALAWLGPLRPRELASVLKVGRRHVDRLAASERIGLDAEGRYSLAVPHRRARASVARVAELLGDETQDICAEWVRDATGIGRRATYAALRDLGFVARRGRGAMWSKPQRTDKAA